MADGTLKFDTKVDDSGYVEGVQKMSSKQIKLTNDIKKTQAEMNKLEKSMKDMQNTKVPTQEYQEIQKQITQAESQLNKYLATEERLKSIGGIKTNSQSWKNLQYNINEARNTLNAAKADMASLKSSGGAFTVDTTRLEKMKVDYDILTGKLSMYEAKLLETQAAENATSARRIGTQASIAELQTLEVQQTKASASTGRLSALFAKLKMACNAAYIGLRRVGNVARTVGNAFLSITRGVVKATGSVLRGAKRMLSAMNPLNKLKGLFSGMWGRMIIMSIGFMALTKALQAIGKGFSAIIRTSPQLSANLAQIKGNLYTAFQPILQACLPALNALFSALVRATAALAQFISMLFGKSVKTSQAAAKSQYDQAKALDATASSAKKAKKELKGLADFDELHNTNSNKDEGGSGSGGAGDSGVTPDFTTPIKTTGGVSDFVNALKKAWKEADFTEIGVTVANKLSDALEAIPWDKIKEKCNKIATCVATFINGFMSVKDLWVTIGRTIGERFNTSIEVANTFISTLDWSSLGNSIGLSIQSMIDTIEWDMLAEALSKGINGIFSAIDNVVNVIDFSKLGTTMATTLNNTIKGIDWKAIGKTITDCFNGAIDTFYSLVKKFNWSELGTSIGSCLSKVLKETNWLKIISGANELVKGILTSIDKFIREIDWKNLGSTIGDMIKKIDWVGIAKKAINLLIDAVKALLSLIVGLGSSLGSSIWSGIKKALSTFGDWFGKLFDGAWTKAKGAFTGVGKFFDGVWSNIKSSFKHVSSWLESTFSKAWKKVKDVFCTGGKIFTGLKEGIADVFKIVVNGLITGINKIISAPFKAINGMLNTIRNVKIPVINVKPFSGLWSQNPLPTPSIPPLATGTVVPANYGNFLAMLGDNKREPEVVSPVSKIEEAVENVLNRRGNGNSTGDIHVHVYLEGKEIHREVVRQDNQYAKQTGHSAFALGY